MNKLRAQVNDEENGNTRNASPDKFWLRRPINHKRFQPKLLPLSLYIRWCLFTVDKAEVGAFPRQIHSSVDGRTDVGVIKES